MRTVLLQILITASIFLLSCQAYCFDGVILVLKAPLFPSPDLKSKVVQYQNKGDVIYIYAHDNSPLIVPGNDQSFYITIDNLGNKSYIPTQFVNIRYADLRELSQQNLKVDPTDHRLPEPLLDGYPFLEKEKFRGLLAIGVGTAATGNYPYQQNITKESRGNKIEFAGMYAKNAEFDKNNRFYFGAQFSISSSSSQFTLEDRHLSKEQRKKVGIGPYISYDLIDYKKTRLIIDGGFQYNYATNSITQYDQEQNSEERDFTAYTLTPKLGAMVAFENVFPDINFITGITLQYEIIENLESKDRINSSLWWRDDFDKIRTTNDMQAAVILGLLFK